MGSFVKAMSPAAMILNDPKKASPIGLISGMTRDTSRDVRTPDGGYGGGAEEMKRVKMYQGRVI